MQQRSQHLGAVGKPRPWPVEVRIPIDNVTFPASNRGNALQRNRQYGITEFTERFGQVIPARQYHHHVRICRRNLGPLDGLERLR